MGWTRTYPVRRLVLCRGAQFVTTITGAPGGNDPILQYDPMGFPRILYFPMPFEFMQIQGRVLQMFERDHVVREIWCAKSGPTGARCRAIRIRCGTDTPWASGWTIPRSLWNRPAMTTARGWARPDFPTARGCTWKRKGRCPAPPYSGGTLDPGGADATRFAR
jgi:hypothetical protein